MPLNSLGEDSEENKQINLSTNEAQLLTRSLDEYAEVVLYWIYYNKKTTCSCKGLRRKQKTILEKQLQSLDVHIDLLAINYN